MPRLALAAVLGLAASPAHAERTCYTLTTDFTPAPSPHADPGQRLPSQIVAWIEDANGTFVDTVFITAATGTYGIGNRPGRFDFNSAPLWPYGRRTTVFPVWSRKHGLVFPELVFQNEADSALSHIVDQSSRDPHFCAPLLRDDDAWDAMSCASVGHTDKGKLSGRTTGYPPREDHVYDPARDDVAVTMFAGLNPFDAVSRATPPEGVPASLVWAAPPDLPPGEYTLWLEVAREFDHNASYNPEGYPSPQVSYGQYGLPYRGQPSVLYRVPFRLGDGDSVGTTAAYAGYGDPDGLDGRIREPDTTITTDIPGSGAARLALTADGHRVRVTARGEIDGDPPGGPLEMEVATTHRSAALTFVAPGDDGILGTVVRYEVRYAIGDMTPETFTTGALAVVDAELVAGGGLQTLEVDKLIPETNYAFGIRAVDNCGNTGALTIVQARTEPRPLGEVDACFLATAAYGSAMAADVRALRAVRDTLRTTVLGELAVETYYTFSPALAGLVGESELLRATARAGLAPLVARVTE